MSSSFMKAKDEVISEIQQLTLEVTEELQEIWTETFDTENCESNIKKLPEHVAIFYKEIILETRERQRSIRSAIEALHKEAITLRRLLNVDIQLSPQKNVPLHLVQIRLDESLQNLREVLKNRKDQIYELLLEQEALCDELGENPRALEEDPLPTQDEIADFRLHLDALKAEKTNRIYLVSTYRRDIKSFMAELETSPRSDEEEYLLNDRSLALTQHNVDSLKSLRDQIIEQMEELRISLETIKGKIKILWDFLDESQENQKKFSKYTGYSQTTYDKFYHELNRCEAIKRQNVKFFVDKMRDEIQKWWDLTLKSDYERSLFKYFTSDCYTDDLLALHEIELEELKRFYSENEQIFAMITERKVLWDRMSALEAKSSEPGRFNNRGGQLLKEEKERKMLATKLPKIEAKLTELVQEYETRYKKKFTIYGDDILELIQIQWEDKQSKKEQVMSARKLALTPNRNNTIRTPLSAKPAFGSSSILSAKRFPSSANLHNGSSAKRKLHAGDYLLPVAKRNLLTQLENSPVQLRQTSSAQRTPFKHPSLRKPKPVIGTITRKPSTRLSGNAKKRRSKNKNLKKIPKVMVNDKTTLSSETCYDSFEDHIQKDPSSRSSIMQENSGIRNPNHHQIFEVTREKKYRMFGTPSKINILEPSSSKKSPNVLTRSQSVILGGTPNGRKLTTKNLPIII